MRLISRFRDYYDGCQGADREPKPVYVRETSVVATFASMQAVASRPTAIVGPSAVPVQGLAAFEPFGAALINPPSPMFADTDEKSFVVASFCGRIHVGWTDARAIEGAAGPGVFFERDELISHWRTTGNLWGAQFASQYREATEPDDTRLTFNRPRWGPKAWAAWTGEMIPKFQAAAVEFHRRLDAPLFVACGRCIGRWNDGAQTDARIVVNPSMHALGLQRYYPAAQSWQMIDMFLGNELAKQEDPAPLSDDLRRDSKGFDEWSFKNPSPGGKKARRRARKETT
jgi:hypothetical protein